MTIAITCPNHHEHRLARIEPTNGGLALRWDFPHEFRRMREDGERQVRESAIAGEFLLEDARAQRWAENGWSIETWCPTCRQHVYRLPVSWLREVMHRSGRIPAPRRTAVIGSEVEDEGTAPSAER